MMSSSSKKLSTAWRGMLLMAVGLSLAVLLLSPPTAHAAAVTVRRSVRQSNMNMNGALEIEECRTNAVCGWQIYNASTRVHQRYVTTTCRCNKKDVCARAEDDIGVPAYVYRCRDYSSSRRNRTTTTPRPTTPETSAGSSS